MKLPNFHTLPSTVTEAEQALDSLLATATTELTVMLEHAKPEFHRLINLLESHDEQINDLFKPISHLHAVDDKPLWRELYLALRQKITVYETERSQNERLYAHFLALITQPEFEHLSLAEQHLIHLNVLHFKLSGVSLAPLQKQEFKALELELASLTTRFENNILDSENAFSFHTETIALLKGLPDAIVEQAQVKAKNKGYAFELNAPTYQAMMMYAEDRSLRETFYQAYATRASCGLFDNTEPLVNIVNARQAQAKLLGFAHYADYALSLRMVKSSEEALDFLYQLVEQVRPKAETELQTLTNFAHTLGHQGSLCSWDIAYYSEHLKQQQFGFSEEDLRLYFPIEQVLQGLFNIVKQLYGINLRRQTVPVWSEQVFFYEVLSEDNIRLGGIYFDLYAREHKQSGAWMDGAINRRKLLAGQIQCPVAFLTTNFRAAKAIYLSHDEVTTLFHEFGHVLHHVLTQVDYASIAGTQGVAWDFVELPSQLMENFAYETTVLQQISCHKTTRQPIPDALITQIQQSRTFQSGLFLLRQLEFGLFDMQLY